MKPFTNLAIPLPVKPFTNLAIPLCCSLSCPLRLWQRFSATGAPAAMEKSVALQQE